MEEMGVVMVMEGVVVMVLVLRKLPFNKRITDTHTISLSHILAHSLTHSLTPTC